MLHDKDNVPIDKSHPEEVMVMKMARKIEALKGDFGPIRLVASDPNVEFTNNYFNKVQPDGNLTLHTAVAENRIKNGKEVHGDQRTVWGVQSWNCWHQN